MTDKATKGSVLRLNEQLGRLAATAAKCALNHSYYRHRGGGREVALFDCDFLWSSIRLQAAVARVASAEADMERIARRGKQLQEQEAVVLAHRAVAEAALAARDLAGEAVDVARRLAPRECLRVHAEQADHAERDRAQRHHAREGHAAAEEGLVRRRRLQRVA